MGRWQDWYMAWLREWPCSGIGIVAGVLRATCPEILALCALSELRSNPFYLQTGIEALIFPRSLGKLLMLSTAFLGGI